MGRAHPAEHPGGTAPEAADGAGLVVFRRRVVAAGLREEVEVRNIGAEPSYVELEVEVDTDLAPSRPPATAAPGPTRTRSSPVVRVRTRCCWSAGEVPPASAAG